MKKSQAGVLLSLASITIPVATLSFFLAKDVLIAQQSGRAAFTATKTERHYDKSGRMTHFEESSEAVRSDRSTVRSRKITAPDGKTVDQWTFVDLAKGVEATVDGLTESVTSVPLQPRAIEKLRRQPSRCATEESPAGDTLLGYDVLLIKKNLPGPPGLVHRVEEWVSSELDCFALKQTFFRFRDDSLDDFTVRIVREVRSITPGEPSEELFAIPPAYTERSLSEVMNEMNRRYPQLGPQPCADCEKSAATVKRADAIYHTRRAGPTQ